MEAKLDCIRTRTSVDQDCNTATNCTSATDDAAIDIVKGERCWVDGRRKCVLNIFDEDVGKGDCFGNISCACNKACTDFCSNNDDPFLSYKECTNQRCGCSLPEEDVQKLQDDYFSKDLAIVNETEE